MELFKEIGMFGFELLKVKTGIRIDKEEVEEVKKICISVGKNIDKTAGFINKNQLAGPILNGVSKISNIILLFCGFIFILALLILVFASSVITSLATIFILMLLCRFLIVASAMAAVIILLVGYAKLKK